MRAAQQINARDPERSRKISEALTGITRTPETRENMSKAGKESWRDPAVKKRRLEARAAAGSMKPNLVELMLWGDIQKDLPAGWEMNIPGGRSIAGLIPDFVNEEKKQVIEMFGSHWHDEFRTGKTPADKIAKYKDADYDCIVVWDGDVRMGIHMVDLDRFAVGVI